MAQRTLPQLASAPNIAAFVRDEQITLFATVFAISLFFAPVTLHSKSLVAPSPSPAMHLHRYTVKVFSAFINSQNSSPSELMVSFCARPFASIITLSLVDVSPSTLTMLKVFLISSESAF